MSEQTADPDQTGNIQTNNSQQTVFVCVEVLWQSQPNGVMLSAVSFLYHTFTEQAVLYAINRYCAHSSARNWQLNSVEPDQMEILYQVCQNSVR